MLHRGLLRRQIAENALRKNLAELNAPLIVAVDVPDYALDENLVLVKSDERTERLRRELISQKRIRRLVALESLKRNELLLDALLGAFLGRLAERESLGLCEEVGHELVVEIADGIVGLRAADEVAGNKVGTLMDELIERVLAVRAGLAPLDGTGSVSYSLAVLVDALAVRLHIHLLEISGEARKILIVRKDAVALCSVAVMVENTKKRENDGHVALEAGRTEMAVHLVVALQKLLVVIAANGDHKRKTDRRGERVAAADPIPKAEHILDVDTEIGNFLRGGRNGDKVLCDSLLGAELLDEPCLSGLGVGHGLLGRERLRRDDKERLIGLHLTKRLGEMGRVDVGDEEELHIALRVGRKREISHYGTEIAAADTDVDDVLDALAGKALPLSVADRVGEISHRSEHLPHAGHDVLAVDLDLRLGIHIAKCGMKNGAAFGGVDLLTREHLLDFGLEIGFLGELDKCFHHLAVDAVLGIVEEPAGRLERKSRGAIGIFGEVFLDRLVLILVDKIIDLFPGFCVHFYSSFSLTSLRSLRSRRDEKLMLKPAALSYCL